MQHFSLIPTPATTAILFGPTWVPITSAIQILLLAYFYFSSDTTARRSLVLAFGSICLTAVVSAYEIHSPEIAADFFQAFRFHGPWIISPLLSAWVFVFVARPWFGVLRLDQQTTPFRYSILDLLVLTTLAAASVCWFCQSAATDIFYGQNPNKGLLPELFASVRLAILTVAASCAYFQPNRRICAVAALVAVFLLQLRDGWIIHLAHHWAIVWVAVFSTFALLNLKGYKLIPSDQKPIQCTEQSNERESDITHDSHSLS